ncbi:MAG TPA: ADP-ribosylation factor-like protein [Candidatus Deferrimicrobium sp.]|nr:ADP-ribosylation factor-like protein [Candidatus Deferrimicrobium sp.]
MTNEQDAMTKIQNLLKIKVKFANIEEIFVLPPSNLKGVTAEKAELLEQFFQIDTIEDLATKELDVKGMEILLKNGISKEEWENWKAAAKMIYETPEFERQFRKVLVIGLDNAGKSSVINIIQRELGLDTLLNIKPTRGIFREQVELQSLKMSLWDLSGQKTYREQFTVEEKNLIFEEVDIILFVVDIQASDRFQEVFDYLSNVITVLTRFKESPPTIILCHKADPDFIETAAFRENYIGLRSVVDVQLENANLKYDYYITSIYNSLPKEQGFRESVKSTVDQLKTISQTAVPSNILNIMANVFDLVVKLSSIIEDRMNQLEIQYVNLESYIQSEFIGGVKTIEAIEARLEYPELKAKEVIVDELQKIMTRKKRKKRRTATLKKKSE